jgi:hypothetical protein
MTTDSDIIEKLKYLRSQVDGIKNNNDNEINSKGTTTQEFPTTTIVVVLYITLPFIIYYSLLNAEPHFIMNEIPKENSYFMTKEISYFFIYIYTILLYILLCLIIYYIAYRLE